MQGASCQRGAARVGWQKAMRGRAGDNGGRTAPPQKSLIFWRQNRRFWCILNRILIVQPARGPESTPPRVESKYGSKGRAAKVAGRALPQAQLTRSLILYT